MGGVEKQGNERVREQKNGGMVKSTVLMVIDRYRKSYCAIREQRNCPKKKH